MGSSSEGRCSARLFGKVFCQMVAETVPPTDPPMELQIEIRAIATAMSWWETAVGQNIKGERSTVHSVRMALFHHDPSPEMT